jgi:Protein of unknown function (DUF4245)
MSETGPSGQRPDEQPVAADGRAEVPAAGTTVTAPAAGGTTAPPAPPAVDRMAKFTYRNMFWSMVPLVAICLLLVGWSAFKNDDVDPVKTVETTSAVRAAAEVAGYPVLAPQGLGDDWRSTSVRTNAGSVRPGGTVTLQIGWYTPHDEYAEYVSSDDPRADALTDVLRGATGQGSVQVAGTAWDRRTSERGETVLLRTDGPATLLITGSASDRELETLAGSLRPVTPPS